MRCAAAPAPRSSAATERSRRSFPTHNDGFALEGAVALVTGANRGLGRHLSLQLMERGATVYAGARNPEAIDVAEAIPLRLDVTDGTQIAEAAKTAWGPLNVARAFAPILAGNGGGAVVVVNVLSALSWFANRGANDYHVSKAAGWAITNGLRLERAAQGTHVMAVHPGAFDTDMMADYDGPKGDPADIARGVLDGLSAGKVEVLSDEWSRFVKASLGDDPADFYARLAAAL